MLADLAALTPPLVIGGAFLIGVILFLRRQMGTGRSPPDGGGSADIPDEGINDDPEDPSTTPSADHRKV